MSMHRHLFRAALCATLFLPLLLSTGCSDDGTITRTTDIAAFASGNWQISANTTAASGLPVLSGEFTLQAGKISGIVHSQSATACVSPGASLMLTGSAGADSAVTLTGPVAGGTLTLTGTLSGDGRSLADASYTVVGGSCAHAAKVQATAQQFLPITGNYTGPFADADGQLAQVTANFNQSSAPDANGNFTLAGSATVSNNPCFPTAVPVSSTQVTGGTFTFTYAANGNSVTANGTFSSDAKTLTVSDWTASGSCGADTGVGSTMVRQGS